MPGFSLIAYVAAIDTLRIANRLTGIEIYTWDTITPNNSAVKASNGLEIEPTQNLQDVETFEILFVCGGTDTPESWSESIGRRLRQQDRKGVKLGSLCAGTYILAKAGLLDGYRCTIHWENIASTREEFPQLQVSDDIYEIDRNRYTCAGGTAAIDMMHHIVSMQNGRQLASAISEWFVVYHVRGSTDRQSIPLRQKIGANQPKLIEAMELMEANIEDPFKKDELSDLMNISRHQLDRLFKSYLNCSLSHYYLALRLRNAKRLLLQTEVSIADISVACGFSSAPHFSKRYTDMFGLPPRDERRRLLLREESLSEV
ncbi:MAG: transcriptional regulator GlxA family with amidase domain [Cocleimonas sp.]|jgi:transcriptional regulator GlxA family with amidase domain